MGKQNFNTTYKERLVYGAAVMDPKRPRTQKQISAFTGIPKSTVSDCIQRLLRRKFIAKINDSRADIFYRKSVNYPIIEAYIKSDLENERREKDQVDTSHSTAHIVRTHLNGGWITIPVEKEGNVGYIEYKRDPFGKAIKQALFGDRAPKNTLKGQVQYTTKFLFNERWYTLQYLRSIKNDRKTFKIAPPEMLQSFDEAKTDRENDRDPFYAIVSPLLNFLERWAGWIFKKDGEGNYAAVNKCRVEYGFDKGISDIVYDMVGDNFGVPGQTPYWTDRSDSAMGENGEFETNRIDEAEALLSLPDTTRRVRNMENRLSAFEKKTNDRLDELEERQ